MGEEASEAEGELRRRVEEAEREREEWKRKGEEGQAEVRRVREEGEASRKTAEESARVVPPPVGSYAASTGEGHTELGGLLLRLYCAMLCYAFTILLVPYYLGLYQHATALQLRWGSGAVDDDDASFELLRLLVLLLRGLETDTLWTARGTRCSAMFGSNSVRRYASALT
eukprot:3940927-Rhodomonas_salina.2